MVRSRRGKAPRRRSGRPHTRIMCGVDEAVHLPGRAGRPRGEVVLSPGRPYGPCRHTWTSDSDPFTSRVRPVTDLPTCSRRASWLGLGHLPARQVQSAPARDLQPRSRWEAPVYVVGAAHLVLFSNRDLPLMEPTGRVCPDDATCWPAIGQNRHR